MAARTKVTRISQHFKLRGDQSAFEFVDVALNSDSPFFLDPRACHTLRSEWGEHCVSLLQTFFDAVMNRIRTGDHDGARALLSSLSEPNETHLGLSRGQPAGRGMGKGLAEDMWAALSNSGAAATGLLQDLEDTVLFRPLRGTPQTPPLHGTHTLAADDAGLAGSERRDDHA